MAQQVRTEHDLPTLRIAFGDGGHTLVRFWLVRGGQEPELVAACPATELGPIDFRDGEAVTDDQFSLPSDVLYALAKAVPTLGESVAPPATALWLELVSPRGYLHLLPWEQLLAPLARPLVRLPNYTVRPRWQSANLDVVLCSSSSVPDGDFAPAATLARLARLWLDMTGLPTTVHLFCDDWAHAELASRLEGVTGAIVHDPAQWEERAHPTSMAGNAWLEWMGGVLEGRAVDVFQFAGHGYLSAGRGSLALASSPTSTRDVAPGSGAPVAEFVGAAKLAQFVAGRGAWTSIISGAADNYSGAALREVADALAINSPGISIAHDLGLDPDVDQLTRVVELVFAGKDAVTEAIPGICCWVHPKFVEYPEENLITSTGHSAMVKEWTQSVLAAPDTPASVASGTRYLESLQATWITPEAGSIDRDAVTALQRVSDLLERRSAAWQSTDLQQPQMQRHQMQQGAAPADPSAAGFPQMEQSATQQPPTQQHQMEQIEIREES